VDLWATYTVHLRLIGKPVVDFLFVLIELFSLGFTAEALRANIDWKLAIMKKVGQFRPNFHVVWDVLAKHFCTNRQASECLTILSLTVLTQRNFVADFLQVNCNFTRKTAVLRF